MISPNWLIKFVLTLLSAAALLVLPGCGLFPPRGDDYEDVLVLDVTPTSQTVAAGSFVEYQVSYRRHGDPASWLDLVEVTGTGVTLTHTDPVPGPEGKAVFTVRAAAAPDAANGPREVLIKVTLQRKTLTGGTAVGHSGNKTVTALVTGGIGLDINVTPDTSSIGRGESGSFQVTLTPTGGFGGFVTLRSTWLRPSGSAVAGTVGIPPSVVISGPQTLNFDVVPDAAEQVGPTTLRIWADRAGEVGGETVAVNVTLPGGGGSPTFRLSASPTSVTMGPLTTTNVTLRVIPEGGFTGPVTVEVLDVPMGWATALSPAGPTYGVTFPLTTEVQVGLTQNLSIGGVNSWTARLKVTGGAISREISVPVQVL